MGSLLLVHNRLQKSVGKTNAELGAQQEDQNERNARGDRAEDALEKIKDQKAKIKIAESPRCGDDFHNFAICLLHFDLSL